MANTGDRIDPFLNFNFRVEIDGIQVAAFHECSGLDSTIDVIEHREGGGPIRKLPGITKFSNIVLKRGVTDNRELYDLHLKCIEGKVERKNGSIILMDRADENEVARWDFSQAWPAKWVGPTLSAEGNDVAIETLELAHEGLRRV
jgi:phage tail-like protein